MKTPVMTSFERVLTSLSHQEPDRVPLFLLFSMQGARELRLSLKDYYADPEHVAEGQLRLRRKFGHDCYYTFFYASIEIEALGGEVQFIQDGPVNSGKPLFENFEQIRGFVPPAVADCPALQKVCRATTLIKARSGGDAPIIGVVMSPFSLPVMQLGFDRYFDLMYENRELYKMLLEANLKFCTDWANAQLQAGATAICYFDPVSSPTIVPASRFLEDGFRLAKTALPQIHGPAAIHMASGRVLPILDRVVESGAKVVGVSANEDLRELKKHSAGKITLMGNLNGIEMRTWSSDTATAYVKQAIRQAGPGGGFILSDNHGEIPYQVSDQVLHAIADAVRTHGEYPIRESS
jgi:uroporphyrinogen decarboxylase